MIELIAAAFGWFVIGWACRGLQLERLGRNSNGNCVPLPPAPPYSSAAIAWQAEAEASRANFIDPSIQRIYRGAMWREKGSDVWHPIGKEPDWADLARQQLNRTTPPPREP